MTGKVTLEAMKKTKIIADVVEYQISLTVKTLWQEIDIHRRYGVCLALQAQTT
jgi:hypothetical protein